MPHSEPGQLPLEALDLSLRFLQQSLQGLTAAKRGRPGTGANAHAILSDAAEIDQTLLPQQFDRLLEQLIEELQVVGAEIGEGVVIDGHATTQPAKGVVMDAQISK